MAKREISAKAFVKDFRSGMDQAEILDKYSLSNERLQLVLQKLVTAKALGQDEIDAWLSAPKTRSLPEDSVESGEVPVAHGGVPRRLRVSKKPIEHSAPLHSAEKPLPQRAGSDTAGYRLKLYGRTNNDADAFCADLAAVLGIEMSTAREYLNRVPVTIKEGLSEQKAERLRSILASVGALCLVEPVDEVEEQSTGPVQAPETSIADALLMRTERSDYDSEFLPSRVRPSLVALIGIVLFLSFGGFYLLISTRAAREDILINAPRQKTSVQEAQAIKTISDEEALSALKEQITYLEQELPKLDSRLAEEKAGFALLAKTPGVKFEEMQKKSFAIHEVQGQISDTRWQLKALRKKVALLERYQTPVEETQSASQAE